VTWLPRSHGALWQGFVFVVIVVVLVVTIQLELPYLRTKFMAGLHAKICWPDKLFRRYRSMTRTRVYTLQIEYWRLLVGLTVLERESYE